ncbi:Tat pathway signal protein [Frateuria aurantia]
MDRRTFLHNFAAAGASATAFSLLTPGLAQASPGTTDGGTETLAYGGEVSRMPPLQPAGSATVREGDRVLQLEIGDTAWSVYEDFSHPDGDIVFRTGAGDYVLGKRVEACFSQAAVPYMGMKLADIALADADLLADRLLAGGEPDPLAVRDAAYPVAGKLDPPNGPWTTFLGNRECLDTIQVFPNGNTITFKFQPGDALPHDQDGMIEQRYEGVIGGWMPGVHKVFHASAGRRYDVLLFGDVDAKDRFIVQTWHRIALIENDKVVHIAYGYTYPNCPPHRTAPSAEAFYRALLRFSGYWHSLLGDVSPARVPEQSWVDIARFGFSRELVVRPGGTYPKYGAVDRAYYGSEYDGFQDIFTSSLYANLEWGRFDQAAAVLDGYFSDFVEPSGMVNMRGAEFGQFGLTLSLLARYLEYTQAPALLVKHRAKIEATAQILLILHDDSLKLARDNPGYGLIHGWNESDACLGRDTSVWWKPYYANSALAVRGLTDLAEVWERVDPQGGAATAADWRHHAGQLQAQVLKTLRANIRHDLSPPYVGPLPGVKLTFRQSMKTQDPSEQGWPHRAYAELLQAGILPDPLADLVIDCMRGHGATSMGVVANIGVPNDTNRDLLGFISYGYAQQLLRLGRIDEYLLFLYSHRYHAHTAGSWTAGEVTDISGGMPLFCMPAQLTMPLLMKWLLVFDDTADAALHLAKAVPTDWLKPGRELSIEATPTRWGRVSLKLSGTESGVSGQVTLPHRTRPKAVWLSLRVPAERKLKQVLIDGKPVAASSVHQHMVLLQGEPGAILQIEAHYV